MVSKKESQPEEQILAAFHAKQLKAREANEADKVKWERLLRFRSAWERVRKCEGDYGQWIEPILAAVETVDEDDWNWLEYYCKSEAQLYALLVLKVARDGDRKRLRSSLDKGCGLPDYWLRGGFLDQWGEAHPLPQSENDSSVTPVTMPDKSEGKMTWQDAADRMKRLRDQGEPFTSYRTLADNFECSTFTINKAIKNTPGLQAWAKRPPAVPRAQSLNPVVTDC